MNQIDEFCCRNSSGFGTCLANDHTGNGKAEMGDKCIRRSTHVQPTDMNLVGGPGQSRC